MYKTLCGTYRDPDGPNKEKETSNTYKAMMREHEGGQFIIYLYNIKGWQASIQKDRKQGFKEAENVFEVHFSALYVII